jgi:hypothetical protein
MSKVCAVCGVAVKRYQGGWMHDGPTWPHTYHTPAPVREVAEIKELLNLERLAGRFAHGSITHEKTLIDCLALIRENEGLRAAIEASKERINDGDGKRKQ